MTEGCSPKPGSGAPLPHTIHTQLFDDREVELRPVWGLSRYIIVTLVWEGWKMKPGYQPSHKKLNLQSVLPARCARTTGHRTCDNEQAIFALT